MKKLLILYHTQSGATRTLAESAYAGAKSEAAVESRLLTAMEAGVDDLLWADGLVYASPENFGYLSGGLKDFFDRTFYAVEARQLNLPYGVIISAGNDGTGALRQLQAILKAYPMRCIASPVIIKGPPQTSDLSGCRELGQALAAGLSMGIY